MDRQMKEQLSKLDQLLQLFSKQKDSIVVVNNLGSIIYLNINAERMFNVKSNEVVGNLIHTLILDYGQMDATSKHKKQYIGNKQPPNHFLMNIQEQVITIENEQIKILLVKDISIEQDEQKIEFINKMQKLQTGIFAMTKNEEGDFIYTMALGKLLEEIDFVLTKVNKKNHLKFSLKTLLYLNTPIMKMLLKESEQVMKLN